MAELKRKSPWDDPAPADAPAVVLAPVVEEVQGYEAPKSQPVQIPMRRINFDVPADLHRQLRMKAASDGVTIAEVGRRLLEQWLTGS